MGYQEKGAWFRLRNIMVVALLMNALLICNIVKMKVIYCVAAIILLILSYLYINLIPVKRGNLSRRINIMISGHELLVDICWSIIIEMLIYISILVSKVDKADLMILIINAVIAACVLIVPLVNGCMRIMMTSRNLGVINRILILLLWWCPIVNIIIIRKWCKIARYEYYLEQSKELRNNLRKENEVCKTKYPIVMVHGIFFRDWMFINYWGRIPRELIRNGAEIFYGHQQSSNAVCKSAEELKENILKIINDTGCGKVNIIAHSKGGLDSRYAISCLGLSEYVASLTTINTPHRGCRYVDFLLDKIPDKLKEFIAIRYNKIFTKLGDKDPDFLSGVIDLTAKRCAQFNKNVLDDEKVYYQSITSKMKNAFSAGFPLNIGYVFAKIFDGENDGLVGISSAKWGNFLGVKTAHERGISHGDVIDLTRQDIRGYDVCEFFVDIVKKLKEQGF